jgi:hypothetical protein
VTWEPLAAFSQIYSDNWEQKAERKIFESFQFGQKRGTCKVGAKEGRVAEEISAIKNDPYNLPLDKEETP